jgi:7-keto-8-aminopelargonate synthetase-like enzyme
MGTLGKALGGFGAYIAGRAALRELLINRCRSFIFTTSLPPAVMAMAIAAIELIRREPERRRALRNNCARVRDGLLRLGYSLGDSRSQSTHRAARYVTVADHAYGDAYVGANRSSARALRIGSLGIGRNDSRLREA